MAIPRIIFCRLLPVLLLVPAFAQSAGEGEGKKILILVEGRTDPKSQAIGDGRQLANLLGHFHTTVSVQGVDSYVPGMMKSYDLTFYIGFTLEDRVPQKFREDLFNGDVPLVWIHTGFAGLSAVSDVKKRFGFFVSGIDSSGDFDRVVWGEKVFTKDEPNINVVHITDQRRVRVLASATSSRSRRQLPYIVRSGSFLYVADCPFAEAGPTDRYLLFADMLHDILGEQHEESHTAIIRIEDVNPLENPDKLRDIADILSSRGIPFLVGVIPIYVDPEQGLRVTLSDKPEIVDALKYMVRNGGTIVMHGTTHQYKGVTASDFEFWDEKVNGPIAGETAEADGKRIEVGIQEFMKNGLYPLAWETPHYAASALFYQTIARYFSTAVEQRLVIENFDYSQYFPYVINQDIYGQKIYPENLGFFPLELEGAEKEQFLQNILAAARTNLQVRDGFASHFFHAFVDLSVLERLVDGIQSMGYTYMDLREQSNWVKTRDRFLCSGNQSYAITLNDQYLQEAVFDRDGELIQKSVSDSRIAGLVQRSVRLEPGQFYKAEPVEFRERKLTFMESLLGGVSALYDRLFAPVRTWDEARCAILWNHFARGGGYNDQASFAAVFRSLNIRVDTIFTGQSLTLSGYNLVIVPYAFVDSMTQHEFDVVTKFVEDGGCLITDTRNALAEELGIRFGGSALNVSRVLDRLFPEEHIAWRYQEPAARCEYDQLDEVFCVDFVTEAPLVIGKKAGKGKVIFMGTRFDPYSQLGYSHYPFLMDYVRRYFSLGPVVRRDNLEMYFDPGFRRTQSIEQLVKLWVRDGIRRVHVAGWHQYPKYTYDYDRLIRLAHANGILVYAWLEPPQVSQKFWLEHPQWREKNYRGEDVRPSWRYPVALTDTACLTAAVGEYTAFLRKYDWDGVNLAELYFEAGRGFADPALWSPMHPSAVSEVRAAYGFDLRTIFDPKSAAYWKTNSRTREAAVEYRTGKLKEVYLRLLSLFRELSGAKSGFQTIVTAMDGFNSPELREYIGVDMPAILGLQKEYGFVLQVEDPEHLWSTEPTRYLEIGRRYSPLVSEPSKLMLDLNILSFRKADQVTSFPTLIPTGTESYELVHSAALGAGRSTVYSEASVNPQDLPLLPYACAAQTSWSTGAAGDTIVAPFSVGVKMPMRVRELSVDGLHITPGRDNVFLIPAGTHHIVVSPDAAVELSEHQIQPRILSLTGSLLSATYGMRSVEFEYEGDSRVLVAFDSQPTDALLDGHPYSFRALKGNDCYTMMLPQGRHSVAVTVGGVFSYGVNITSFWSTTGIAIFGLLAVTILLLMYVLWVVVRRRAAVSGG